MPAQSISPVADELYGTMLTSVHAWMSKYHPDVEYAAIVVHIRDGIPDVLIPVTAEACEPQLLPS